MQNEAQRIDIPCSGVYEPNMLSSPPSFKMFQSCFAVGKKRLALQTATASAPKSTALNLAQQPRERVSWERYKQLFVKNAAGMNRTQPPANKYRKRGKNIGSHKTFFLASLQLNLNSSHNLAVRNKKVHKAVNCLRLRDGSPNATMKSVTNNDQGSLNDDRSSKSKSELKPTTTQPSTPVPRTHNRPTSERERERERKRAGSF